MDPWDDPCPAIIARVLMEQERMLQDTLLALVHEDAHQAAVDGAYGAYLADRDRDLDPF